MKILLVGEYSRLHNSLKEGLLALGHEVTLVGTGDNFKDYAVDHSIKAHFLNRFWLIKKLKNFIYLFARADLEKIERAIRFYCLLPKLKGFDHVQFINSDALEINPKLALWLYKKLLKQNGTTSLLVCGDDTPVIEYYLNNKLKYSILTPYIENKSLKNKFQFSLKYLKKEYKKTFNWLYENASVIITSDLDYKIPMEKMGCQTTFIPNPVNTDKINFEPLNIENKIIIFLGINQLSYTRKGISFFEKALKIIKEKYKDKVEIIITENVPYATYINSYNKAHIILDQIYSYDQGYNALEAMAKGKVVFTGAEAEFITQFNLENRVAVNALPDVMLLVKELSFLIENPHEINEISKHARQFIEKEHHYINIAQKYLESWINVSKTISS